MSVGCDEKWMRGTKERIVIMTRHGWFSCRLNPNGYIRITEKNLLVVQDWEDMDSHFYSWYNNPNIDFEAEGFPFSLEEVTEICRMEHMSARLATAMAADCGISNSSKRGNMENFSGSRNSMSGDSMIASGA